MLLPEKTPAEAKPLTARPRIKTGDDGAVADMADPMANRMKEAWRTFFMG